MPTVRLYLTTNNNLVTHVIVEGIGPSPIYPTVGPSSYVWNTLPMVGSNPLHRYIDYNVPMHGVWRFRIQFLRYDTTMYLLQTNECVIDLYQVNINYYYNNCDDTLEITYYGAHLSDFILYDNTNNIVATCQPVNNSCTISLANVTGNQFQIAIFITEDCAILEDITINRTNLEGCFYVDILDNNSYIILNYEQYGYSHLQINIPELSYNNNFNLASNSGTITIPYNSVITSDTLTVRYKFYTNSFVPVLFCQVMIHKTYMDSSFSYIDPSPSQNNNGNSIGILLSTTHLYCCFQVNVNWYIHNVNSTTIDNAFINNVQSNNISSGNYTSNCAFNEALADNINTIIPINVNCSNLDNLSLLVIGQIGSDVIYAANYPIRHMIVDVDLCNSLDAGGYQNIPVNICHNFSELSDDSRFIINVYDCDSGTSTGLLLYSLEDSPTNNNPLVFNIPYLPYQSCYCFEVFFVTSSSRLIYSRCITCPSSYDITINDDMNNRQVTISPTIRHTNLRLDLQITSNFINLFYSFNTMTDLVISYDDLMPNNTINYTFNFIYVEISSNTPVASSSENEDIYIAQLFQSNDSVNRNTTSTVRSNFAGLFSYTVQYTNNNVVCTGSINTVLSPSGDFYVGSFILSYFPEIYAANVPLTVQNANVVNMNGIILTQIPYDISSILIYYAQCDRISFNIIFNTPLPNNLSLQIDIYSGSTLIETHNVNIPIGSTNYTQLLSLIGSAPYGILGYTVTGPITYCSNNVNFTYTSFFAKAKALDRMDAIFYYDGSSNQLDVVHQVSSNEDSYVPVELYNTLSSSSPCLSTVLDFFTNNSYLLGCGYSSLSSSDNSIGSSLSYTVIGTCSTNFFTRLPFVLSKAESDMFDSTGHLTFVNSVNGSNKLGFLYFIVRTPTNNIEQILVEIGRVDCTTLGINPDDIRYILVQDSMLGNFELRLICIPSNISTTDAGYFFISYNYLDMVDYNYIVEYQNGYLRIYYKDLNRSDGTYNLYDFLNSFYSINKQIIIAMKNGTTDVFNCVNLRNNASGDFYVFAPLLVYPTQSSDNHTAYRYTGSYLSSPTLDRIYRIEGHFFRTTVKYLYTSYQGSSSAVSGYYTTTVDNLPNYILDYNNRNETLKDAIIAGIPTSPQPLNIFGYSTLASNMPASPSPNPIIIVHNLIDPPTNRSTYVNTLSSIISTITTPIEFKSINIGLLDNSTNQFILRYYEDLI
jgi:hypothetical protein